MKPHKAAWRSANLDTAAVACSLTRKMTRIRKSRAGAATKRHQPKSKQLRSVTQDDFSMGDGAR